MDFKNLKVETLDKITTLTLSRPESLNVLSKEMLLELRDFLHTLKVSSNSVRGIILAGAGNKAFSAGGDIKLMSQLKQQGGEDLSSLAQSVTLMMESLPVPIIACVDGFALGGGCELAMSCDFIYATKNSKFGQPEVKIGLIPGFGGSLRLLRLVGPAIARELLYTGRQIFAEEAQRIGLVNLVVETPEQLFKAAAETMGEIQANSSNAVATAKATLNKVIGQPTEIALTIERKAYAGLFEHPDKVEGIQAFLEKRKANF